MVNRTLMEVNLPVELVGIPKALVRRLLLQLDFSITACFLKKLYPFLQIFISQKDYLIESIASGQ